MFAVNDESLLSLLPCAPFGTCILIMVFKNEVPQFKLSIAVNKIPVSSLRSKSLPGPIIHHLGDIAIPRLPLLHRHIQNPTYSFREALCIPWVDHDT